MQIERIDWRYRALHWGTQADVQVMTVHAAELLSDMTQAGSLQAPVHAPCRAG